MAKQFTRINKDITIAVKAAGPDPVNNPRPAARDRQCPRRQHAQGQGRVCHQARGRQGLANYEVSRYEGYATRESRSWWRTATDNPNRTVSNVRQRFQQARRNLASTGSVSFMFKRMGGSSEPGRHDQDDLELYLIDHGLDEMGGEHRRERRTATRHPLPFPEFGSVQKALEDRGITPLLAEQEYLYRPHRAAGRPGQGSSGADRQAEQDEDVQRVFQRSSDRLMLVAEDS